MIKLPLIPNRLTLSFFAAFLVAASPAAAQPRPRDVFREYNMATMMWRVGERWEWGGSNWGRNLVLAPGVGEGVAPFQVDLTGATRAEVTVGYDHCHGGTSGLAIAFNDHDYLRLPVADTVPEPVAGYMSWPFPTVPVPLSHLAEGVNQCKFRIDATPRPQGGGGWFQHLVYAVVLRVYYGADKPHVEATLSGVAEDGEIGRSAALGVTITGDATAVDRVDYVGQYLDFDHDGDGIFREWQYRYQGHEPAGFFGHIGTSTAAPFGVTWDTSWLPDQVEPMNLSARVVGRDGVIFMVPEVRRVRLVRPGLSVEMCIPYNVPAGWVTRKGRMGQKFRVAGDLSQAREARLLFRSWGENDGAGGWLNGQPFPLFQSGIALDTALLRAGENTLENAPGGHHGLEVAWPGAVVLIRYETP